eukprot:CAMPEP_0113492290 /NCGR_PEP_ID=MMETSP0014_2-20120614/27996_1 /TAXON_ID=2857 /ORGANISM="Nitzschia sp." /LENGTH=363 /DNA_ID=CAMNT_0000386109 /DNA_START=75 /DNA_END=1162 /DNA_ORIENTATION=+ /assembly_acc=CAM_ASM_000159
MSNRNAQPRGRGANSQPAIMMMPPHIRATFMPAPPLRQLPPITFRRKHKMTGCIQYLKEFETTPPPERKLQPTPKAREEQKRKKTTEEHQKKLQPSIDEYRPQENPTPASYQLYLYLISVVYAEAFDIMSNRNAQPRGRGANSQPAIMMMPPHIRATFMPAPPLRQLPPITFRRKHKMTGCVPYLKEFETSSPPERKVQPTPKAREEQRRRKTTEEHQKKLQPSIDEYRDHQREFGGEFHGMNCYNTLFVGRLAYEVTERKLLREMESFGSVKDLRIAKDKTTGRSKGYGFVEYEHEEDMKRAYRAADGMRIEGRPVIVDVERGHTVPTWLPRRLGGGLGGRGKGKMNERGRGGGGGGGAGAG